MSKVYDLGQIRVRALRDVSLRIETGDLVAIMGSSGSGKSTLMNILGCLDVPTTGRYLIDGIDVSRMDEDDLSDLRNRKIGFVFQSFNLVARTSALVNVELPLAYAGLRGAARRKRAEQALRSVGMGHRLEHQPSELSGGQQQRVAVARAIVTNPALILADEPTGNLDSHSTEDVLAIFARLNDEGRTVVLITHEPDVAEQSKRVVRLSDGRIVEDQRTLGVHDPPPLVRSQKSAHAPIRPGAVEARDMIGPEMLRIAWSGITANKLRSGLTILGMTIGVASVIVLIAVGNGSSKAVQSTIQSLGTNVLVVQPTGAFRGGARANTANTVSLTKADAEALQNPSLAPDVKNASPVVDAGDVSLTYNGTSFEPSSFLGTTPSYLTAHSYKLAEGAAFTAEDVSKHRRVAVIGQEVVQELFAGASAVGQNIKVNGSNYEVVGVLAKKGTNGTTNEDDVVMAPITTVQDSLTGTGPIDSITVQATSESSLDAAEAEVTTILEERHRIKDTSEPGFSVLNQGSLLETSSSTSSVFTTLLGEVAAISLLVGGIGVMNIMLVSVTERTREIGIRKAVGARRADILTQFLTEAVLVSVFGGVIGVLVGVIGSQFEIAGVHPEIATYSIFLAFGAALASGLFFGTYPAARAARLRPIEALRFE